MADGALWMIFFKWCERGLGLISTLILVRLLTPADFGMVAMAMSLIFMGELLAAFSFDVALIQNSAPTDDHFHSAWTANVLLGGGITALTLGLAWPMASFYGEPRLFAVMCVLAFGPLIAGTENIGVVTFRKELQFRKEFGFLIFRKLAAFLVTIPLAFWLRSFWALVIGMLASKLASAMISYWVHPFRPRYCVTELRSLMRFSRWLLLTNLVNFFKERSSDFVVGRLQGPAALGLYNISLEFANLPTAEIGMPVNRALLPGFAKMSADPEATRVAFSKVVSVLSLVAIPVGAGLFAVAPFFVPVALGKSWLGAVPLMEVLSLNSSVLVFHGTIVTVLVSIGRPSVVMRVNLFFVFILLSGMWPMTQQWGALGAAYSVLAASIVSTPLYLSRLRKWVGIPIWSFFRATHRPAIASALMIVAVRWFLPGYDVSMTTTAAMMQLAGGVAVGIGVYTASIVLFWLAVGRPEGGERLVFEQVREKAAAFQVRRSHEG